MAETMTAKSEAQVKPALTKSVQASVIGGIVAGIIFGILMQMMGRIGMIASMMGSESLVVGWGIHMVISVVFAIGFGLVAVNTNKIYMLGILHGIAIWIIGPLVVMPMMMGMGTMLSQAFSSGQLMSLLTHLMFSLILAFVYKKVV
ncbi:hypothetical protein Q9251_09240 [Alkalihalobacillus macyae]|uniref:hypothetical protein n=1 Tax=Guptibacillus hwajinpoensis TaxID=208199 RepID=UPI00273CED6B|nr:hypothetical protein [Alkalihalobacillus macyae]MDP4551069.1 hypothetical protein [Alkalihalobacillus macyae]